MYDMHGLGHREPTPCNNVSIKLTILQTKLLDQPARQIHCENEKGT